MDLKKTIAPLVEAFATELSGAIFSSFKEMSLEEVIAYMSGAGSTAKPTAAKPAAKTATRVTATPKAPKGDGTRVRRSADDLEVVCANILEELAKHEDGMRAEELRSTTGIEKKDLGRPIALLLQQKRIKKTGEKRATTYFVTGKGAPASKKKGSVPATEMAKKVKAAKAKAVKAAAKPAKKAKAKAKAKTNGASNGAIDHSPHDEGDSPTAEETAAASD
jgi:hypothetical protein